MEYKFLEIDQLMTSILSESSAKTSNPNLAKQLQNLNLERSNFLNF